MSTTTAPAPRAERSPRAPPALAGAARIPFARILRVELRKMFDTRSGFWLMASVVILSVVATGDGDRLRRRRATSRTSTFASAVGFPMTVILPMIAILAVTSEWSQRTALTTFTLVPHRGRVLAAKARRRDRIGVVSMLVAAAVGAVGNVVGSAIAGVDPIWNITVAESPDHRGRNELGMLIGLMLGIVLRSSPGAIVAYFVYSFVLPGASSALAAARSGGPSTARGSTSTGPSGGCSTSP